MTNYKNIAKLYGFFAVVSGIVLVFFYAGSAFSNKINVDNYRTDCLTLQQSNGNPVIPKKSNKYIKITKVPVKSFSYLGARHLLNSNTEITARLQNGKHVKFSDDLNNLEIKTRKAFAKKIADSGRLVKNSQRLTVYCAQARKYKSKYKPHYYGLLTQKQYVCQTTIKN